MKNREKIISAKKLLVLNKKSKRILDVLKKINQRKYGKI